MKPALVLVLVVVSAGALAWPAAASDSRPQMAPCIQESDTSCLISCVVGEERVPFVLVSIASGHSSDALILGNFARNLRSGFRPANEPSLAQQTNLIPIMTNLKIQGCRVSSSPQLHRSLFGSDIVKKVIAAGNPEPFSATARETPGVRARVDEGMAPCMEDSDESCYISCDVAPFVRLPFVLVSLPDRTPGSLEVDDAVVITKPTSGLERLLKPAPRSWAEGNGMSPFFIDLESRRCRLSSSSTARDELQSYMKGIQDVAADGVDTTPFPPVAGEIVACPEGEVVSACIVACDGNDLGLVKQVSGDSIEVATVSRDGGSTKISLRKHRASECAPNDLLFNKYHRNISLIMRLRSTRNRMIAHATELATHSESAAMTGINGAKAILAIMMDEVSDITYPVTDVLMKDSLTRRVFKYVLRPTMFMQMVSPADLDGLDPVLDRMVDDGKLEVPQSEDLKRGARLMFLAAKLFEPAMSLGKLVVYDESSKTMTISLGMAADCIPAGGEILLGDGLADLMEKWGAAVRGRPRVAFDCAPVEDKSDNPDDKSVSMVVTGLELYNPRPLCQAHFESNYCMRRPGYVSDKDIFATKSMGGSTGRVEKLIETLRQWIEVKTDGRWEPADSLECGGNCVGNHGIEEAVVDPQMVRNIVPHISRHEDRYEVGGFMRVDADRQVDKLAITQRGTEMNSGVLSGQSGSMTFGGPSEVRGRKWELDWHTHPCGMDRALSPPSEDDHAYFLSDLASHYDNLRGHSVYAPEGVYSWVYTPRLVSVLTGGDIAKIKDGSGLMPRDLVAKLKSAMYDLRVAASGATPDGKDPSIVGGRIAFRATGSPVPSISLERYIELARKLGIEMTFRSYHEGSSDESYKLLYYTGASDSDRDRFEDWLANQRHHMGVKYRVNDRVSAHLSTRDDGNGFMWYTPAEK